MKEAKPCLLISVLEENFPPSLFRGELGIEQVCEFAKNSFSVTFPIMDKVEVNGGNAIPLYGRGPCQPF